MRKTYLDDLRTSIVLLVVVYHSAYLFNGLGIPVGITAGRSIRALDILSSSVYPWFMVLLFIISGISARYSLDKRGVSAFIKERTDKLLVPSTLGLLAFHIWTGYFNMKIAGADFSAIPKPILPFVLAVSGTGVLWYAQMLWLFSLLVILVRKIGFLDKAGRCSGYVSIILCSVLICLSALVLNTPVITVYRFGIYFMAFILGYFVFSHESVMEKIDRGRYLFLTAAAAFCIAYNCLFKGKDYTVPECLMSPLTSLYAYFMSVALLGIFRHYAGWNGRIWSYIKRAGFGIYVFHYTVMATAAYFLIRLDLPYIVNYAAVTAAGLLGSAVLYEAVRRIPFYRYAVLGIRKRKSSQA